MKQITETTFNSAINDKMVVRETRVGQADWTTYSGRGIKGKIQVLYVKRNYRNQISFFRNDCNDDGII